MSKATGLWNAAKEAYRAAKGLLSKNERNTATAQAKKERGPVKAMFHITKNENVPAIEQQGLVANNPNANVNSAYQPFRSVGVKGGGNWVTDRPTAFPVYGTTVGGKHGNEAARRDALTTFKIEFPVSKLPTTRAVRDPYGNAKLTTADKGWSLFGTWAGDKVNTMAILEDIDPKYLKNIGYVEELNPAIQAPVPKEHLIEKRIPGREYLSQNDLDELRSLEQAGLNKADRTAMSYMTGHDVSAGKNPNATVPADRSKSPARFVEEYLDKHRPIKDRSLKLPNDGYAYDTVNDPLQYPYQVTEENHGYLRELPLTAADWTEMYRPYTKFGEAPRKVIFQPGAYSRGIGTIPIENIRMNISNEIKGRNFNWNTYLNGLRDGMTPKGAALQASPRYYLDWDNIVYNPKSGYAPNKIWPEDGIFKFNAGAISRGRPESSVRNIIGEPINLKQLSDVRKASTKVGDAPKKYLIDRLNRTDAAASNELEVIAENATWADIIRAVMKANVNSK